MEASTIASRLAEARKAKRLKQRELAEMVGVKTSTYSAYETGHIKPSAEMVYKLSEALTVTPEWIVKGGAPQIVDNPQNVVKSASNEPVQPIELLERQLAEKQAIIEHQQTTLARLQAQVDQLLSMLQSQLPGKLRRNQLIGSEALIRHMPLAYPQELRA